MIKSVTKAVIATSCLATVGGAIAVYTVDPPAAETVKDCPPPKVLRLSNEKTLGYAEYGPKEGRVVLFLHDFGHSREALQAILGESNLHEQLRLHNIRLICPDRSGYGHSGKLSGCPMNTPVNSSLLDFQPSQCLVEGTQDLRDLMEHVKADSFTIIGHGAGTVHGLAYVAAQSKAAPRVDAVFGLGLGGPPEGCTYRSMQDSTLIWLLDKAPPVGEFILRLGRLLSISNPSFYGAAMATEYATCASDTDVFSSRQQDIYKSYALGALKGIQGLRQDYKLVMLRPWGFNLTDVESTPTKLWLWQGENDPVVPSQWVEHAEKLLPSAVCKLVPSEGHISLVNTKFPEVLGLINENALNE